MRKRLSAIFVALCLVLTLVPTAALADEGEGGTAMHASHCVCGVTHSKIGNHESENVITDWTPVSQQSDINGAGNYYLTKDVTLNSQWMISNGVNIVLCLNGKTLTADNASVSDTIFIYGTLTITDCNAEGTGKITGTNTSSGNQKAIQVANTGALNLYAGTITGINVGGGSGTIHNRGTFNMYGGSITNNKAAKGGGVFNWGGNSTDATFNMYGGTISGNEATSEHGGGVYVQANKSIFNMYGGTITSNKALTNGKAGGGVFIQNSGAVFNLYGGEIYGNNASQTAGNDVHIWDNGKMNAYGGTIGGAVYNQQGSIGKEEDTSSSTTFNGAVTNGDSSHNGTISAGTFNGTVTNTSNGTVDNTSNNVVNNGTFVFENSNASVSHLDGTGSVLQPNTEGEFTVATADALATAVNAPVVSKIVLDADVTLTSALNVSTGRTLTLDLNGNTLSRANNTVIANNGTLTVKNGKVHMTGNSGYVSYFAITNSGTLTLESTLTVESDRGNAVLNTAGTLNTAADMKAVYNGGLTQRGSGILLKGGTVNVTGGTIEYMQYALSTNADSDPSNGSNANSTANVTGGTMKGYRTAIYWPIGNLNLGNEDGTGPSVEILKDPTKNNTGLGTPLEIAGGTVNVKGGTFKGVSTTFYADTRYFATNGSTNMGDAITVYTRRDANYGNLSLTISGGTFTSASNYALRVLDVAKVDSVNATINISGGEFTSATGKDAIHVAKKSAATIASNITNPAITGGTFSTDPSAYVASGYYVVKNISTTATADTWTVYQRTYSGGSSSSNTTTSTVTNPDGSVTTTTTNKTTGVTTEVTKNTDGSVDTVITNKDGSTTESTKTAGGTSATVETDKNGDTTSVSASVSSTDAKNANKSGGSVSLPLTGVTPAASSEEAQTIDIDVPSNVSSVTVEIPVEDVTPGTVVIIVNKDGTETIVPTSTVTENGIEVTLTEDATIKIVDNSKTFNDVPKSNVFHDEIAAMSARGIMVGKTDDTFDVYGDVTLNQIVNVAGRVSGAVATEDYEGGIAWGEANGLATGDTPATRGQVILALYVAAGSPDAIDTGKLSAYSDGASVPSELLSAVLWAVENGILKGTDAGTLDLGSNVTRGQAAAFAGRTLSVIG